MKRLILTLCLVLACGTAYSGEKEHRALAEELIKITDGDKVMDGMKASCVFSMIFNPAVTCRDDFGVGIVGAMQFVRNGGVYW